MEIHDRVARLEKVISMIVVDFYAKGEGPSFLADDLTDPDQEIRGLRAQVEHLREQRDQVNPILELKDARISELEGIELILREKLTQKQDQLDEALRDAEFWNREAGNADDHAASIQDELDNLRVKLAGLL